MLSIELINFQIELIRFLNLNSPLYVKKDRWYLNPEIVNAVLNFFILGLSVLTFVSCEKEEIAKIMQAHNTSSKTIETTERLNIYPEESKELVLNPGKGFVKYWDYEESYKDLISIGYSRFDWADIEPKSGVYNWSIIDNEIQKYKENGKKFAFGVMCANTNRSINTPDKGKYVTPKWVFDAGAKGQKIQTLFWETGQKNTQIIPVWNDETFIENLNKFVTALGKHYNGNSGIAFIDIRSYGNWGEQHLYELGGQEITPDELRIQHLQLYKNAFPNTQLITPWGSEKYDQVYDWAVQNGIGMRSDGIFKYSDGSECLRADKKAPGVFEYTAGYDWIVSEGLWSKETLKKYIETGKPSYIQFDSKMYTANKDLYTQVGNRVGYHFVLKNVNLPSTIKNNIDYAIETEFINKGVTQIYQPCSIFIALTDSVGNIVQKQWLNGTDPLLWMSDKAAIETSTVSFKNITAGKYTLALGLFADKEDANPTYKLGNNNKTANNWYVVAKNINVQ